MSKDQDVVMVYTQCRSDNTLTGASTQMRITRSQWERMEPAIIQVLAMSLAEDIRATFEGDPE